MYVFVQVEVILWLDYHIDINLTDGLCTQIMRRDEELAPFVSELKRNYIFGGISSIAANVSIKVSLQFSYVGYTYYLKYYGSA